MSAAVHTAVRAGITRIHFIAPTTTDFHVNVEGKSGIFATCGRDPRPRWVSSRRRLEWPNGAMCVFFSGEEPESLRGPEAEIVVIDEIARMRYQQSVFDTMMLGLRLGDRPRVLIATTPRTTPFMKRLVAMDDIRITTGSTYDKCRSSVGRLPEKGQGALRRHSARPARAARRYDPRSHERAVQG